MYPPMTDDLSPEVFPRCLAVLVLHMIDQAIHSPGHRDRSPLSWFSNLRGLVPTWAGPAVLSGIWSSLYIIAVPDVCLCVVRWLNTNQINSMSLTREESDMPFTSAELANYGVEQWCVLRISWIHWWILLAPFWDDYHLLWLLARRYMATMNLNLSTSQQQIVARPESKDGAKVYSNKHKRGITWTGIIKHGTVPVSVPDLSRISRGTIAAQYQRMNFIVLSTVTGTDSARR